MTTDINPNPINATDLVPSPSSKRKRHPSVKPDPEPASPPSSPTFDTSSFILSLDALPADSLTFDEISTLMTAMTRNYDRFGVIRAQKHAALEEGSHLALCTTCGRKIDISKPGGYQIQTRRDAHFMPYNAYFCDVNCILSENLRGKRRPTPGPHNQAGAPPEDRK